MENSKQQRRVSFAELGQGGRRESFTDKTQNWFQKQFSGSHATYDHESLDSDFTSAIAAAAFAVHSLEEASFQNLSMKDGSFRLSESARLPSRRLSGKETKESASLRKRMEQDYNAPSMSRSRSLAAGYDNNNTSLTRNGRTDNSVEKWEKAEMAKILKRYEKSKIRILGWENEKKMRAKSRMEAKKFELEQKRAVNWQHYQNKLGRIDHIAGGARRQAEEQRRNEEKMLKEKAKRMKSKGHSPYWICC